MAPNKHVGIGRMLTILLPSQTRRSSAAFNRSVFYVICQGPGKLKLGPGFLNPPMKMFSAFSRVFDRREIDPAVFAWENFATFLT